MPQNRSRPAGMNTQSPKTIVYIDDCPTWRQLIEKLLAPHYSFYTFSSWSEAFPALSEGRIDLLMLDINMPGLQGPQIAQMYRYRDCPILLFSTLDKDIMAEKALECGADGILRKVDAITDLRPKIQSMLTQATKATRPVEAFQHQS